MEKRIGNYTYYTDGRIYSHKKKRFLIGHNRGRNGYNVVVIDGKTRKRHICIAEAFIPNTENLPQVNHIDEDKSNNCVENLEWCTAKYNCNHGTRNHRISESKINGKKSKKVAQYTLDFPCELIKVWPSINEIGRVLGISPTHICKCCKGIYKSAYGYQWSYWEE